MPEDSTYPKGLRCTEENLQKVKTLGFDYVVITANPSTGVTSEGILEGIRTARAILGTEILIVAGKMHGAGAGNIYDVETIEAFIGAGADVILLPAPGTVPGFTVDLAKEFIDLIHKKGVLAMTTIGTSQEGATETFIESVAQMSKMAGADIQQMSSINPSRAREFANHGMELMTYIENLEKPVIAAVNGFALGGGCELALACDLRIASSKAKFGQPEVGLGITPGFGGTQRLSRLIGSSNAKLLIYTGNIIDANEAYRMGLVNSVVEPDLLISTAEELASNIASKSQMAVKYSKTAINKGIQTDIDTGLEIEKNLFALCFASQDQKEGMTAFLEKRKPNFK